MGAAMTDPHVHTVTPPPSEDTLNQQVVRILEAAATYEAATAALAVLLKPYGIGVDAILLAVRMASQGTTHKPRTRGWDPKIHAARDAARLEAYFRAAYILRAARRIQADLDTGYSLRAALIRERRYWQAHEKARRARLDAAKAVLSQAQLFGPVLGWYVNHALNNEAECLAADLHNFDARIGTVIGWPGAVHMNCGCTAGPPVWGAGWVDDAVRGHVRYGQPLRLRPLRRKAG